MFNRFCFLFFSVCISFLGLSQTLTIATGGNSGTAGTNWSISGTTLTVTGTASIQASVITNQLANNNLSIVGNTSNFVVNVNQAITASALNNLTIGSTANTGSITISTAISVGGALTIYGGDITLGSNLSTTGSVKAVKVLATNQIINSASSALTTQGGDILLSADRDASGAGNIYLAFTFNATSNGGDITFAGGDDNGSGFAYGFGTLYEEGIDIRGALNVQSGGGDIFFRGKSDIGVATGDGIYGVGLWDATDKTINSGSGTIYIEGYSYGSDTTNDFNYGVTIDGTTVTITSANSSANAIVIKGFNYSGGPTGSQTLDGRGIDIRATTTKIYATGGGSILMQAHGYYGYTLYGTLEILANAGSIELSNVVDGDATDFYLNGSLWLGSKASTSVTTSSANIILKGDDYSFNSNTPDVGTTGMFKLEPAAASAFFDQAVNNSWFTLNANNQTIGNLVIGKVGNAADVVIGALQTVAGPISIYGGTISVNQNLSTTQTGAAVLIQATEAINLAASKVIQTSGGDVTLNACSGGAAISVASAIYLYSGSQILTSGGDITLGGAYAGSEGNLYAASNISGGGYAVRLLSATLTAAGGDIRIYGRNVTSYGDGVYLSEVNITTTGAGTVGIYGDSYGGYSSGPPPTYFGGITFDIYASLIQTVNGNLTLKGILTQSQSSSGYGINFYRSQGSPNQTRHIQLLSQTGDINITGDAGSTIGGGIGSSSWGNIYVGSPVSNSFNATGNVNIRFSSFDCAVNNGIIVKTTGHVKYEPTGTSYTSAQVFPANTYAVLADGAASLTIGKPDNTANVTISSAQSVAGDLTIYGGTLTLNGNLTATNNGNVSLYSNNALGGLSSPRTITAAGLFSYIPQGNSFASGLTYPITNLSLTSTGLLLGKPTNTAALTFNATTINGPITGYGGSITVSGALSAAGNILLDADTGGFLSQNTKGVVVNAAITTSNNGNISIFGRGGSGTAQSENHGIHVLNTIQAGGTGTLSLTGYGGLSANSTTGSSHGVFMDGVNAWAKTNAGNLTITGNGGGVNSGSYSQGIAMSNSAKVSTGGSGQITMTGTGGVNTAAGMRGIVLVSGSSVYTAGGSIELNGIAGSNGADNSDGVTLDAATVGSNSSGPITITGTAGSGSNSEAIALSSSSTIGAVSYANNITLKANNFVFSSPASNVTTTGQFTIEPTSVSFSSPLSFPITNLTVATGITGLTIGKPSNATALTLAATTINGPITLYGGALTLSGALATTNTSTGNMSLNGTTLSGGSLSVANGRTLTMNLSATTTYAGTIGGTGLNVVKDGAGILTLTGSATPNFATLTISAGTYTLNNNQQLTLSGALTNNGTFTLKDGATFVQATSGTSITGSGTYNVEKQLTGNATTWNSANNEGRFWYMGVPMVSVARSSFGTPGTTSNKIWSYSEATKQYTEITDGTALLSAGTGYVHRRNDNNLFTYTASGTNGLYGADFTMSNLTRTAGAYAGYHLIANPYMSYLDWEAVTSTNIESTYYIRSASATNISALISCNKDNDQYVSTAAATIDEYTDVRYIAPLQSLWVRVGTSASTGAINTDRSMLSHQGGNPGLKNTTVYPVLARVNLVNDARYDQLLVFMNEYQSNATNNFDSEKMFVSGEASIYTMASGKKLVMNGLKNNKKKISVPLYLELPTSKVYQLQLSDYIMEDGLILLEDKQEGTIQDFTIHDVYAFYANSGVLSNRFVLHFYMPDAGVSAQGPSNSWVEEESAINEGGSILVSSNGRGKVTITQDIDATPTEKGSVVVRDAAGREIYNGQLTGSATNLELDAPSGIYFVSVELNGQVEVKKIFVQQ